MNLKEFAGDNNATRLQKSKERISRIPGKRQTRRAMRLESDTLSRTVMGKLRAWHQRGNIYVAMLAYFGVIVATIGIYCEQIGAIGLSVSLAIILSIPLFLVLTVAVGWIDEKFGIWKQEMDYTADLTPSYKKMRIQVDTICSGSAAVARFTGIPGVRPRSRVSP